MAKQGLASPARIDLYDGIYYILNCEKFKQQYRCNIAEYFLKSKIKINTRELQALFWNPRRRTKTITLIASSDSSSYSL